MNFECASSQLVMFAIVRKKFDQKTGSTAYTDKIQSLWVLSYLFKFAIEITRMKTGFVK